MNKRKKNSCQACKGSKNLFMNFSRNPPEISLHKSVLDATKIRHFRACLCSYSHSVTGELCFFFFFDNFGIKEKNCPFMCEADNEISYIWRDNEGKKISMNRDMKTHEHKYNVEVASARAFFFYFFLY